FCGVVGLKPTYGRVSRYGLVAFASTLEHVGPLTRDGQDAALVLETIAGLDPHDSTSVPEAVPHYAAALTGDVRGIKIGVPKEYFTPGMDADVQRSVREAIAALEKLGAATEEISLPMTDYGIAVYYIIAPAEASSNLARYDGVKYGLRVPGGKDLLDMVSRTRAAGFGAEVKGRTVPSAAASARPDCRSGCRSSAAPSTSRASCGSPTPTSRRPPGSRSGRSYERQAGTGHEELRNRHRAGGPRSAPHALEDVLWLPAVVRRGAQHGGLPGVTRAARPAGR